MDVNVVAFHVVDAVFDGELGGVDDCVSFITTMLCARKGTYNAACNWMLRYTNTVSQTPGKYFASGVGYGSLTDFRDTENAELAATGVLLGGCSIDVCIGAYCHDEEIWVLLGGEDCSGIVATATHAGDEGLACSYCTGCCVVGVAVDCCHGGDEEGLAVNGEVNAMVELRYQLA